jgi:hypothetical protein
MANEIQTGDIAAIIKDLMNRRAALDAAITNLVAASGALKLALEEQFKLDAVKAQHHEWPSEE